MKRAHFVFFVLLGSLFGANVAQASCEGIYNHQFKTLQGENINLCDYQKQPLLLVNTASKCGFTPQFEKLETMYRKYKDKGLMIIGFPSNDFKQELASNMEIGEFCRKTYAVDFPMISQSSVVGPNANPLYKELAKLTNEPPMWNFYKYLILPGSEDIYVYSSDVQPEAYRVMRRLKPHLK
ncbi:MAG: glutathione peroxidase [Nitrosomonadales bacterium]|nr:glutathione peroxidase [Nitrosomonadales bacterium]